MDRPWEQSSTALACGFDPHSLSERSARRRSGDAGLGRQVVVPVYLRRSSAFTDPLWSGLPVWLSPGGGIEVDRALIPPAIGGNLSRLWLAVRHAARAADAVDSRDGWTRVAIGEITAPGQFAYLVLRDADWALLRTAVELQDRPRSGLQDAPAERVPARFLGRLDGVDGTPAAGLWGRLALEVVSRRHPDRLAETRSLRWYASWGQGGQPAGSAGRAGGAAGHEMLRALTQHRVEMAARPFRVRTLPDWEREQAAHDLGLAPRGLLAWPVSPLSAVVAYFADITPAPLPPTDPQDAR